MQFRGEPGAWFTVVVVAGMVTLVEPPCFVIPPAAAFVVGTEGLVVEVVVTTGG